MARLSKGGAMTDERVDGAEEAYAEMPEGAVPIKLQGKVFHDTYRGEAFVYRGSFYYRYVGDGTGVAGKSVFRRVGSVGGAKGFE